MDHLTYLFTDPAFVTFASVAAVGVTILGGLHYTPADFDHYSVDGGDLAWQTK